MWKTIAEGRSFETLRATVQDQELPKGTPVRLEMTLNLPVARAFDLAGAEYLFRPVMPDGLDLEDVYSNGSSKVIIEARSDPVWVATIVGFIKVHWLAISLITIGLFYSLGYLVTSIKISAPMAAGLEALKIIGILAAIILIVYFIAKAGLKTPTFTIGGT